MSVGGALFSRIVISTVPLVLSQVPLDYPTSDEQEQKATDSDIFTDGASFVPFLIVGTSEGSPAPCHRQQETTQEPALS